MVGRDQELGLVQMFLAAPEDPSRRALLIAGEPGIGKTTLWSAGIAEAERLGFAVLRCRPAKSEFELSYAGLGDLLESILDDALARLPPPQRRALSAALLLDDEPSDRPPDPRAVALAAAAALRALAADRPTLLALDDIQWIDSSSAAVLEFALRRLGGSPVQVLATIRVPPGGAVPLGLERAVGSDAVKEVELQPLSLGALDSIIRSRFATGISPRAMLRLFEGSGGNPFYAIELARCVLRRGDGLEGPQPLPLPETLYDVVRATIAGLPPETRHVLAFAAALTHADVETVETAWDGRGTVSAALDPALAAGVAEVRDSEVCFAHPLLRSAAYDGAQPDGRREVHAALAKAVADAEERAQHLALAVVEPDPAVVAQLERGAYAAWMRGAPGVAAELSEHAVRLSLPTDLAGRSHRRMRAARYHFQAGATQRARELLERIVASSEGPARARALHVLGIVAYHDDSTTASAGLLTRAVADASEYPELQAAIRRDLAWATATNGDVPSGVRHARIAVELAELLGRPEELAETLAVAAFTQFLAGSDGALAQAERAVACGEPRDDAPIARRPEFVQALVLKYLDRFDESRELLEALHRRAMDRGEDSSRPFLLSHLCELECWAGRWEEAATYGREGHELAVFTGQRLIEAMTSYSMALVDAHQGRLEEARVSAEQGLDIGRRGGVTPIVLANAGVLGFVELSAGDAFAADRHLGALTKLADEAGIGEPSMWRFLPDEIEALVALGRADEASALLGAFERRVQTVRSGWASATAARCRGLVWAARGELDEAQASLEASLVLHELVPVPFDRARTLLTLGITRLRANRKRDARLALDAAVEVFESLGAPAWAATARAELRKIGGRPGAGAELTPSEMRVAELVAAGRTNREVAAQLHVTVGTVEGHLSRIYDKLGVRSRSELAHRFRIPTAV